MIIKDEIHGTVGFSSLEERIIDHPDFQRLRRIRQMSITYLVYPGANHTRFEHSIGTSYLSRMMARKLGLDGDEAEKVKLSGLLHDIGHAAFSHEGEDVLQGHLGSHEEIGRKKILRGGLSDIISENYRPGEITELRKPYGNIIESDLGSDRMDYLKRDALNTGVAYGIIDIDRIVHTLCMEGGQLCIEEGGLEAAEYLLIARFMMFSTVYMHKTVRIATAMLYRAIEKSISDKTLQPEEFLELGDESALMKMGQSPEGGGYAKALLDRTLYKEVCSFPKQQFSENTEKELSEKLGCDIIVDRPREFFKPVNLKVKTDRGLEPVSEISKLVQSLKLAEEERMKVLVLADEKTRKERRAEIRKSVNDCLAGD
ncbi:HD domain-containing protein [Candidatus Micrarchaeota archaeon]|nr:HD domain-containing protein [Candidatus Micrarchaeota archaeon]